MHHALRNVWVIAHYACQTTGGDAETWDSSPGDATCCALLKPLRCAPVPSCLIYQRLCPGCSASTSERTWVNLKKRSVGALILIDMLSGDEYFCSSARLPWVVAYLPLPHPLYVPTAAVLNLWSGVPPAVAPIASQVGASFTFGEKLHLSDWSWKLLKNMGAIIVQSYKSEEN